MTDDEREIRGLLLAASLKRESVQLLLGGASPDAAVVFQDNARFRLEHLKLRIAATRRQ